MTNRTHPTILNFKFQPLFLSIVLSTIKLPEIPPSVMSLCNMSINSMKKYLFTCLYDLSDEAHVK